MHFKNPEVLYFLALLIIPVLIHLFQLQKFVKVPFTNVAFLKQIAKETRKSSSIKKWLILATRLLLFLAIIIAFSQPYLSSKDINKKQETFIYLDNSLSTNTEGKKGDLLQVSKQEIIENTSENNSYTLLTNSNFYTNISKEELKNKLLNLNNTSRKLDIESILLKINSEKTKRSNTLYKNILISDFQNTYIKKFTNVTQPFSLIKLNPSIKNNLSIDSVYIETKSSNNSLVNVTIKNQGEAKNNTPIALYNNTKLIGKQSFSIDKNSDTTIQFTIENSSLFLGKIVITYNDTFNFDNIFYFTQNNTKKINVLTIGNSTNFLQKIFTEKEFNFTQISLQNTNYNTVPKQQLIILNELETIPSSLITSLKNFSAKGGNIVVIPNTKIDLNSYNALFNNLNIGKINQKTKDTLKITTINFNHPLLSDVFSKKIQNFQYPSIKSYYQTSFKNSSTIVSFENKDAFIKQIKLQKSNLYWIAGSLDKENSNFVNSPLIVPVFYNFGKMSLQQPKLYYRLDKSNTIDVSIQLEKDDVVTINSKQDSFIPIQQTYQNKISITTKEQPLINGIHTISSKGKAIKNIAFNNPKEESLFNYLNIEKLTQSNKNITASNSIKDIFKEINKKNEVLWLWKWFLGLAIVSLLLEIFILKFFKV